MPTSTSFAVLEQHPDPGTRWLMGEILQASEHFEQKRGATSTRRQREVEGKKAKLSGPVQHSKTAVRWSRSNINRQRLTQTPAWTGTDRQREHFCLCSSSAALGNRTNDGRANQSGEFGFN